MKIDLEVLKKLFPTFGVKPLHKESFGHLKETALKSPNEAIILSAGYKWDMQNKSYLSQDGEERLYFFESSPKDFYIWIWKDTLFRAFVPDALEKWIKGDAKYPNGKAQQFKDTYSEIVGEPISIPIKHITPTDRMTPTGDEAEMDTPTGPVPNRGDVGNAPSEADQIIMAINRKFKIKPGTPLSKQAPIRMSADDIIDLYKKAKSLQKTDPEGSEKLISFMKSNIQSLEENKITKGKLAKLVSEIVKTITEEFVKKKQVDEEGGAAAAGGPGGMSVTANVSPVTGPKAFKRKKELDEMTTTGAVSGYNVPGAFAREGGSKAGVAGSAKLGYELTPIGKKDMKLKGDKLT